VAHLHALDDDTLMRLAAEGSADAFERIVQRYKHLVTNVAKRLLGDECLAQDVAQNTFIWLLSRLDRYQPKLRLRAYLCCIARSECYMLVRKRREVLTAFGEPTDTGWCVVSDAETLLPDLERALARLTRPRRSVVELYYLLGLSTAETARALGIPAGTVKRRLSDARSALRAALVEQSAPAEQCHGAA